MNDAFPPDLPEPPETSEVPSPPRRGRVTSWVLDLALGAGIALVLVLGINWWRDRDSEPAPSVPAITAGDIVTTTAPPAVEIDPSVTYTARMETSEGTIVIELDTEHAPIAAGQFIRLARGRFYDGLTFHRVVPDFVIQAGDPSGTGGGGSGSSVVGEVPSDNYPIGALAAAKTAVDPPGTFDSQFFIVTGAQGATLPNEYARFGAVIDGLDVALAIEALAGPDGDGAPTRVVQIVSVSITES